MSIRGREPDSEGMNFWLDKLHTHQSDRKDLIDQFLASKEFKDLCLKYSIE